MNNDLISREALLKAMEEERQYLLARGQTGAEHIIVHHCLPIIDNAPTVFDDKAYSDGYTQGTCDCEHAHERQQGEWIPVSKRLPEEKLFNPSGSDFGFDFEEVLCTTIWGDVRSYKFGKPIGHDKPHFWFGGEIMDEYVVAWQYKPEPYKKGDAE